MKRTGVHGCHRPAPRQALPGERQQCREADREQAGCSRLGVNMGIGMTVIVSPKDAALVAKKLKARTIGKIEQGTGLVRLT